MRGPEAGPDSHEHPAAEVPVLVEGDPRVDGEDESFHDDDPFDEEVAPVGDDELLPPVGRRDLKAEAKTLEHQLLHATKNPHCLVCVQAFGQRKPNRRRRYVTEFANFGDAVTLDHVDANSELLRSYDGDRDLLVIYDLAIGCLGAYPVKSKGAGEVLQSLVHFAGGDVIRAVYSDRAPTLIAAVQSMPAPLDLGFQTGGR